VRIVLRVQASDFSSESPEALLDRVRELGIPAMSRGYVEIAAASVPVKDPGDDSRTLDVWHEVTLERPVVDEAELLAELRYAISVEKTVSAEIRR
jgi:hypothetical protein